VPYITVMNSCTSSSTISANTCSGGESWNRFKLKVERMPLIQVWPPGLKVKVALLTLLSYSSFCKKSCRFKLACIKPPENGNGMLSKSLPLLKSLSEVGLAPRVLSRFLTKFICWVILPIFWPCTALRRSSYFFSNTNPLSVSLDLSRSIASINYRFLLRF